VRYVKGPKDPLQEHEVHLVADGGGLEKLFPALYEYLAEARHDDGRVRQTATLLIFAESGRWKLCLNDRENARSCWGGGERLQDALKAFEERLQDDDVEWRSGNGRGHSRKS
jgi:hypothetical protein